MIDFATLVARAPKHDPASCSRRPCRRCEGQQRPRPPEPLNHHVAKYRDRTASPLTPLPRLLDIHAPLSSDSLAGLMRSTAQAIRDHGQDRWERLLAWEHRSLPVSLVRHETGSDDDGPRTPTISLDEERLRGEEERTSRYAQGLRDTAPALTDALTDLPEGERHVKNLLLRLRFLIAIAEARKPRRLLSREQTAAQVAADGWCRSCYRVGVFEPISTRPTGEPYYVGLCRWCGSHRGTDDQPSLDIVKVHHRIPERAKKAS